MARGRPPGRGGDWQHGSRKGLTREQQEDRARSLREKAAAFASRASAPPAVQPRPSVPGGAGRGLASPPPGGLRWFRPGRLDEPLTLSGGAAVSEAIVAAMGDRRDRSVLAWPRLPENSFVALSLSLHTAFAEGRIARATAAIWPWRQSLTLRARQVLADPGDLVRVAKALADDEVAGAAWLREGGLEHHGLMIFLLRLKELEARKESSYRVTTPDLREITPAFPPAEGPAWHAPFDSDPNQFLSRVATHTDIRRMDDLRDKYTAALGSPEKAPIAVFGLPAGPPRQLARHLAFPRFGALGLDTVVADLTRRSREAIGRDWEESFGHLVDALDRMGDRRPGLVLLSEDVFALRAAETILRARPAASGRGPVRLGAAVEADSLLGPAGAPPHQPLPRVGYDVALKDGPLLALRRQALSLSGLLRSADCRAEAAAVRAALGFVRRVANLPVGHACARDVVAALHPSASFEDAAARNRFFVDGALAPLDAAVSANTGRPEELTRFRQAVWDTVARWEKDTPVSLKLDGLLRKLASDGKPLPLLVLPDGDTLEMFRASPLAAATGCRATSARAMGEALAAQPTPWALLVKPSPETVRALLSSPTSPERVSLLGDAAGAGLLAGELRPLAEMPAFARVRQRAADLLRELRSSEADLSLDEGEARMPSAAAAEWAMSLDFTAGGEGAERYAGPVVRIATRRGYALAFRPSSEVLLKTPDELRPFRKVAAADLRRDDALVVMTPSLLSALREALARAPQSVDAIRAYHAYVALKRRGIPGVSIRDKAREVVRRIRLNDPSFGLWEADNVVRWLSVDRATADDPAAPPSAPRDWPRFLRFADAIGMDQETAKAFWGGAILITRSARISDGMAQNERAVGFVIDREGVQARAGDKDFTGLWEAILENVDFVTHRETANAALRA